jgi:hypothetical protein
MVKNLGGEWDIGRGIVDKFCASVPRDCPDFSVRWGSGKAGGTTLIFDLGWLNRSWNAFKENEGGYYQCGLNYINWIPDNGNPHRYKALDLPIAPATSCWNHRILAIGQVADDAQHGLSMAELKAWLHRKCIELNPDYKYRPHPQADDGENDNSLEEDLIWADTVVTYNSTVGLEALRMGKKVICSDNCFYRGLCNQDCPEIWVRKAFFERVAQAQWTEKEIEDGTTYDYYRRYL